MIQASKSFNKYISTFVLEFISTGDEEVQRLVQIKIIVSKKYHESKSRRKIQCDFQIILARRH